MITSALQRPSMDHAVMIRGLRHRRGSRIALALDDWRVAPGSHWLILGPSGSGKTTLLHLVAGLLAPTQGRIEVLGRPWDAMPPGQRDRERGRSVGLVFQTLHLIDAITATQNLALARRLAALPPDPDATGQVLERLGLGDRANARPAELSQGEAQRLAIARAVINRPALLLADEPTSALDDDNCSLVMNLLQEQARACGASLLVATHDRRLMERFEHRLELVSADPEQRC